MSISLIRVDDRVIHGQTTTRWSKVRSVQSIMAIGDDVAKDELRKRVLKAAAGNLKVGIYSVDQAVDKVSRAIESDKDFFIISNSPQYLARLVEKGVDLGKKEINIGPMNSRAGAKVLGRTVAIDEKDYEAFEFLESKGYVIQFQLLPDDDIKSWATMKAKYNESK